MANIRPASLFFIFEAVPFFTNRPPGGHGPGQPGTRLEDDGGERF
jgi:hypothetical protein